MALLECKKDLNQRGFFCYASPAIQIPRQQDLTVLYSQGTHAHHYLQFTIQLHLNFDDLQAQYMWTSVHNLFLIKIYSYKLTEFSVTKLA